MCADPLVPIDKRMVADKTVCQSCSFLLKRWEDICSREALKRSGQRRLQQRFIPKTRCAAGLMDQVVMKQNDLTIRKNDHFANACASS